MLAAIAITRLRRYKSKGFKCYLYAPLMTPYFKSLILLLDEGTNPSLTRLASHACSNRYYAASPLQVQRL
jgi:hypothetical protein